MADPLDLPGVAVGVAGAVAYVSAARRVPGWAPGRTTSWLVGTAALLLAVAGPPALGVEHDFFAHMASHLLLGMVAPLLLVLGAPVTLALRVLPVARARRLTRLLRRWPVRLLTEPAVAGVLDLGGLWLLYRTDLWQRAAHEPLLHVLVHVHVLLAGYLFTLSLVGPDPLPHRRSYVHRAAVLVLAGAAHAILAKTLYVVPPAGVPVDRAELGAILMYYGGDGVELVLAALLCARWYRASRPRGVAPAGFRASPPPSGRRGPAAAARSAATAPAPRRPGRRRPGPSNPAGWPARR